MFTPPTVDQIIDAARAVGLHLDGNEVTVYQARVAEQLRHHREFLGDRLDESRLPRESLSRTPGCRPGL